MGKFWDRIKTLVSKRTFWINAVGGALIAVNELNGIIPTKIAAEILVGLNIANRFIKVIAEDRTESK